MVKQKNRNYNNGGWRLVTIKTEIVPLIYVYHGPPTIMKVGGILRLLYDAVLVRLLHPTDKNSLSTFISYQI